MKSKKLCPVCVKKQMLFIFLIFLGFSGLTQPKTQYSVQNDLTEIIDTFITEQMGVFHVPGLSACIIVGNEVVWKNHYGFMNLGDSIPINDSTLFNAFSIGKSLTAACVMQLWENGMLDIDSDINNYLTIEIINPLLPSYSITSRMLLNHSSSLSDLSWMNYIATGDPTISLATFCEYYFQEGGQYYSAFNYYGQVPGIAFHYSNLGPGLNGYLVETITDTEFDQFAKENLLSPLNMNHSGWFLNDLNEENLAIGYDYSGGNYLPNPHRGHPCYPGLSLRTTALELAQFVIMMLNEGQYQGIEILHSATVDSMTTIQNPNWNFTYGKTGLGLFHRQDLGDRAVWGHNGGGLAGYAAQYYFCKEENTGIVVMTNSSQYLDPVVKFLLDYADSLASINQINEIQLALACYPNPFNSRVMIEYSLLDKTQGTLEIFNHLGQVVASFAVTPLQYNGKQQVEWDSKTLPPGVYYCRLQAEYQTTTIKIIKNR